MIHYVISRTGLPPVISLGILLILIIGTCPTSWASGDIDSLVAYKRVARALTNMHSTTNMTDADLEAIINLAAQHVQLEMQSHTIRDAIEMEVGVQEYALPALSAGGTLLALRWKMASTQMSLALSPVNPDVLGPQIVGPIPLQYSVIGQVVLIGQAPAVGDSLIAFYLPRANMMDDDSSSAHINEADDLCVVYKAAIMMAASRHNYQLIQYFQGEYQSAVAARKAAFRKFGGQPSGQ